MMIFITWLVCLVCVCIPLGLVLANRKICISPLKLETDGYLSPLSVLIPARNEASNIATLLDSLLLNEGIDFEVLVLDDHSTDATAEIVRSYSERDSRVRLILSKELPKDWCGKPYACWQLAEEAKHDWMLFLDADLTLHAKALAHLVSFMQNNGAPLASGVPRQLTETWMEKAFVPMIHFVLYGFLPMWRMRQSTHPSYAAACGQILLTHRETYFKVGGHSAVKHSMHEGLKLARAFRKHGFRTDLFDGTEIATCRMYHNARDTWSGFLKNAKEGVANSKLILPTTFLLLAGHVLPWIVAVYLLLRGNHWGWAFFIPGILSLMTAQIVHQTFSYSKISLWIQPIRIVLFLLLQWQAYLMSFLNIQLQWKNRSYPSQIIMVLVLILYLGYIQMAHGISLRPIPEQASSMKKSFEAIVLKDQFGKEHRFTFPSPYLRCLVIADKEGHKQIDPWMQGIYDVFGDQIEYLGVADVRGVPSPMRGFVRMMFRQGTKLPIMLDWSGETLKGLEYYPEVVNLYLLNYQGDVVYYSHGALEERSLQQFLNALHQLIQPTQS